MVRLPTFDSNGMKKGAWSKEEDDILRDFVVEFGHRNWRRLPSLRPTFSDHHVGLARCGKSCRLRWLNYLKPGLKRGKITKQEEELIIKLHDQLGSKWSAIAANLAGRTDNEIKNYWHAHLKKRGRRGGDGINADAGVKESSSSSSSSEIRSCVTTDDHHVDANSAQDLYSFAQDELPYNPTQFDDVDFGIMFEEMQYDHTSTFSDSGTSFCNSTSADFWSQPFGEDILDMVLW